MQRNSLKKLLFICWTSQTELVIRGSIFNTSASACWKRKSLFPQPHALTMNAILLIGQNWTASWRIKYLTHFRQRMIPLCWRLDQNIPPNLNAALQECVEVSGFISPPADLSKFSLLVCTFHFTTSTSRPGSFRWDFVSGLNTAVVDSSTAPERVLPLSVTLLLQVLQVWLSSNETLCMWNTRQKCKSNLFRDGQTCCKKIVPADRRYQLIVCFLLYHLFPAAINCCLYVNVWLHC